ncbi:putative 1-acyl-sn-glycerol-3-phosphate acyltransferase 5 [Wickerhamiella sorbophila]|uniref:Putative 1-acyl-sn-glycerol-3-phosphate acyltransferase 5 n=1 Tax=Wickerhamiella sorbophila TaxID=45607 RepID=A0A2T0FFQ0_9ASCO|nr:putative 1-acyl-sn-glycerol-3-phosphate acyltransferase 5 [Wickerhamiella sorbophila]PRT53779.1 putative 1-acyl-sn-glycerol-3-phosphate acyltransferase 5 [Wickerhamiella sorbophila]
MIPTSEAITAYGFAGSILALMLIFAFIIHPVTRVLPFSVQAAVRGWVSGLAQSGFKVLINKAFEVELIGDKIDPNESAIVILNHSSSLDYPLVTTLAAEHGVGNNYFFFSHRRLIKLPTLPVMWSVWRANGNWTAPSHMLSYVFRDVPHKAPRSGPKWVVLFPEVNEFNPASHREHQLICCAAGAPLLKHLLYPRYPAFVQAVEYFRHSEITTVYDLTVQYQAVSRPFRKEVPTWREFICSRKLWKVTIIVNKHAITDIGNKPKAMQKWLEKTWYRKDHILEKRERKAK